MPQRVVTSEVRSLFEIAEVSEPTTSMEADTLALDKEVSRLNIEDSEGSSLQVEEYNTQDLPNKISINTEYSIPGEKMGELINTTAEKPLNEAGYFEFKGGNESDVNSAKPSIDLDELKRELGNKLFKK